MKYNFFINEGGYPEFGLEEKYWQLWELGSCSKDYLEEIVISLEQVISGDLEQYDFGYEVYSIECRKEVSQVIDTFDGWKSIAEIPTQEVYELIYDWRNFLIGFVNKQNEDLNKNIFKNKTLPLKHLFLDAVFELCLIDSVEYQPGFSILKGALKTKNKTLSIESFDLALEKYNLFEFGNENWIFIPELGNSFLLDLISGERYNQEVWFRENGTNFKDKLIGNYFYQNNHLIINKKSFVVFDLINKSIQKIKFKNLIDEISWAYIINKNEIRLFFIKKNKTMIYNIIDSNYDSEKDIINVDLFENCKVMECFNFSIHKNKFVTKFRIYNNQNENLFIEFEE